MSSKQMLKKPLADYFLQEITAKGETYQSIIDDYYASANDLASRRQEITCLDAVLEKERARQRIKKEEFRKRWAAASKRISNVDENIIRFEKHYNESKLQQGRAYNVIARQDELKAEKVKDINRLTTQKQFLQEILDETSERVKQFKPVQEYLEAVRDSSHGEFKSINELLSRYQLLSDTRNDLLERDDHAREQVRRRQKTLESLSKTKENEAVLLSNDVFELTEEYREMDDKMGRLNDDLIHIKSSAAERTGDIGRVRIAVYNLYLQVCKKMSRPAKIPTGDTLKQLQYVRYSMIEMNKLRREVQGILRRAKVAEEKEKLAQFQATLKRGAKTKGTTGMDMFELFKMKEKKESKEEALEREFFERHKILKSHDHGSDRRHTSHGRGHTHNRSFLQ